MGTNEKGAGLRRAEADLERFFSQSADLLCIAGDDGYFKYVNEAWERIFGWTVEEMTSHPWTFFVHPDDLDQTVATANGQLERGLYAIEFDNRYRTKDGRYIWLRWNSRPNREHGEMHAMARDITEQKNTEMALNTANASLERSNAELAAFTYSAAHDLREPLRTLASFADVLLTDYNDKIDEEGQEHLKRIVLASARMRHLIDDLLTISRVDSAEADPESIDLRALVGQIVEGIGLIVRERHAEVEVDVTLPHVFADPLRVEQIYSNLITNAIKFNRGASPLIEIGSCTNAAAETVFFVKDNGIGIPPEFHETIFGVFQRLHGREEFEGTGAGLAIVKRAVEALGGRIWVESEPDKGTTFLFTLPLSPETTAQTVIEDAA